MFGWSEIKQEIKNMAEVAMDAGKEQAAEIILTGVFGTAAPGVVSAVLAYQQKRQETMYLKFMEDTFSRVDELDQRLKRLSAAGLADFRNKYFGLVSDYALEEVQEEKIRYIVNGLIEIAGLEVANEDLVLSYYDTLLDLRILDIAVLNNYFQIPMGGGLSTFLLCPMLGIEMDQYNAIKLKLERMGLITTNRAKHEDKLYSNIKAMQDYLKELSQGKSNPRLKSLDSLDDRENYIISSYGADFLHFFDAV